jgi:hypothetical protein
VQCKLFKLARLSVQPAGRPYHYFLLITSGWDKQKPENELIQLICTCVGGMIVAS